MPVRNQARCGTQDDCVASAYAHRLGRLEDGEPLHRGASFDVASERVSPSHARYTIRTQETGWTVCVTENGEEKALPLDGELSIVMED